MRFPSDTRMLHVGCRNDAEKFRVPKKKTENDASGDKTN